MGAPQSEKDQGIRAGLTTEEREWLKALERDNREPKRANAILRQTSAYFTQAEQSIPIVDPRFETAP